MTYLTYTGSVEDGQWVAGWPASDHDEPDGGLAEEKLKSGLYMAGAAPQQATAPSPVTEPSDAPPELESPPVPVPEAPAEEPQLASEPEPQVESPTTEAPAADPEPPVEPPAEPEPTAPTEGGS